MRLLTPLFLLFTLTLAFAQPFAADGLADDLIDDATSKRIADAARVAGQGSACGLNWQPYYLTFMQVERQGEWTQTQLAFMGVFFGALQAVEAEKPCSALQRTQAQRRLDDGIVALRAKLVGARYYPADKFVFEPRVQLPERSLEASRRICDQILFYKFDVSPNSSPYMCYSLRTTPAQTMALFRSKLIIMGYRLVEEGENSALYSSWRRYDSRNTLLLAAVPSEGGTYLMALSAPPSPSL